MPYKKPLTPEQKAQARERNKRYRLRKKEENEKAFKTLFPSEETPKTRLPMRLPRLP